MSQRYGVGKEMDPRHGDKRQGRIFLFDIFLLKKYLDVTSFYFFSSSWWLRPWLWQSKSSGPVESAPKIMQLWGKLSAQTFQTNNMHESGGPCWLSGDDQCGDAGGQQLKVFCDLLDHQDAPVEQHGTKGGIHIISVPVPGASYLTALSRPVEETSRACVSLGNHFWCC